MPHLLFCKIVSAIILIKIRQQDLLPTGEEIFDSIDLFWDHLSSTELSPSTSLRCFTSPTGN